MHTVKLNGIPIGQQPQKQRAGEERLVIPAEMSWQVVGNLPASLEQCSRNGGRHLNVLFENIKCYVMYFPMMIDIK
jgi:hypothetical protein